MFLQILCQNTYMKIINWLKTLSNRYLFFDLFLVVFFYLFNNNNYLFFNGSKHKLKQNTRLKIQMKSLLLNILQTKIIKRLGKKQDGFSQLTIEKCRGF